ncbi:hypothetical protein BJX70DRAFT_359447 [Aspergillus crustosus]
MSLPTIPRQWTKPFPNGHANRNGQGETNDSFMISTNNTLLSIPAINAAFGSDHMYWTSALSGGCPKRPRGKFPLLGGVISCFRKETITRRTKSVTTTSISI